MQLASRLAFPELLLAAMPQLSEKPRMGVRSKNQAWHPGFNVCNSTAAIGLQFRCSGIVSGPVVAPNNIPNPFKPTIPQVWRVAHPESFGLLTLPQLWVPHPSPLLWRRVGGHKARPSVRGVSVCFRAIDREDREFPYSKMAAVRQAQDRRQGQVLRLKGTLGMRRTLRSYLIGSCALALCACAAAQQGSAGGAP
jgi:hypothetical protein